MDFLSPEMLLPGLKAAAQTDVGEWCIKATIVFFFVNSKFKKHFKGMEDAVKSISENLTDFKKSIGSSIDELTISLKNLEKTHSGKIEEVSARVGRLAEKFKEIETEIKK